MHLFQFKSFFLRRGLRVPSPLVGEGQGEGVCGTVNAFVTLLPAPFMRQIERFAQMTYLRLARSRAVLR